MASEQFKTEQEEFWAGRFGDEYSKRNTGDAAIASNTALFSRMLAGCSTIGSLIEFGSNIGLNLRAIHALLPGVHLEAVEINSGAVEALRSWDGVRTVHNQSILEFQPERTWDAVLIKGVLIHIDPRYLPQVYDSLYRACSRYLLMVEYYNPTPVEIPYRGNSGKLFKRDFAGEMLDRYPDLCLLDYGFVWRRDPVFPQDDVTWFVLKRTSAHS